MLRARRNRSPAVMGLIIQKCDPLEATAPQKQLPGVVRYCQIAVAAAKLRSDGKWQQNWQDDLTRKIIQLATF